MQNSHTGPRATEHRTAAAMDPVHRCLPCHMRQHSRLRTRPRSRAGCVGGSRNQGGWHVARRTGVSAHRPDAGILTSTHSQDRCRGRNAERSACAGRLTWEWALTRRRLRSGKLVELSGGGKQTRLVLSFLLPATPAHGSRRLTKPLDPCSCIAKPAAAKPCLIHALVACVATRREPSTAEPRRKNEVGHEQACAAQEVSGMASSVATWAAVSDSMMKSDLGSCLG